MPSLPTLETLLDGSLAPLRNGMNLVTKEGVAAQSTEVPGVLVLFRPAGASEELEDAMVAMLAVWRENWRPSVTSCRCG